MRSLVASDENPLSSISSAAVARSMGRMLGRSRCGSAVAVSSSLVVGSRRDVGPPG
jgi:hypothetical protein